MPWLPHPPVSKDIPGVKPFSLPRAASFFFFTEVLSICVGQQCTFGAYFLVIAVSEKPGVGGVFAGGASALRVGFAGWLRQY